MRFGIFAAVAAAAALAILTAPAEAQVKKKRMVYSRAAGHTVFVSRDEDGRRRTRIIVQPRSYLNPGTQTFPGERRYNDGIYAFSGQQPFSVIDNTAFSHRSPLPGPFDLPSRNNPAW